MNEQELRQLLAMHGASLYYRGYATGTSGNISARLETGILISPTNTCLGRAHAERISKVSWDGELLAGDRPSKELFLHLAVYQERPDAGAVVHLHSTHATAVSCLSDLDPADVLPPLTPYYVVKVGKLPLVPYYRPGSPELAAAVRTATRDHHAMLLANHGLVVSGRTIEHAVYAAEELEESAKLFLTLRGMDLRVLSAEQVRALTG